MSTVPTRLKFGQTGGTISEVLKLTRKLLKYSNEKSVHMKLQNPMNNISDEMRVETKDFEKTTK